MFLIFVKLTLSWLSLLVNQSTHL